MHIHAVRPAFAAFASSNAAFFRRARSRLRGCCLAVLPAMIIQISGDAGEWSSGLARLCQGSACLRSQLALARAGDRSGTQGTCGLRANDPVSGQAVVRLEVDHVHLGDRAENAVGSRTSFLLDHCHVITFHEG